MENEITQWNALLAYHNKDVFFVVNVNSRTGESYVNNDIVMRNSYLV